MARPEPIRLVNDPSARPAGPDFVHYVIVVHGMGEARKNETFIDVVNRFAEARARAPWPPPDDVLTLGRAFGNGSYEPPAGGCRFEVPTSDGVPWVEFRGIPADPTIRPTEPFLGELNADPRQNNLRFVDLHWGDLLEGDFPHVGQDPNDWANGLLGRLVRRDEEARRSNRPRLPFWSIRLLEILRETIALLHGVMRIRARNLDDLVFTKYLGDVQVYAEYAYNRGRAVRRFHESMARIEARHRETEKERGGEPREARYTIIAHSLGTVMTMDALLYARAPIAVRTGQSPGVPDFPFPGYVTDGEREQLDRAAQTRGAKLPFELAYLKTDWIRQVDTLVTLGSPIDKFLFIWWLNYRYLDSSGWIPSDRKIHHLNYSDEQDPVGHRVVEAVNRPAFRKVFRTVDDRVFNRYVLPGIAHIQYWKDLELFRWILAQAVDRVEATPPAWFDRKVFRRVLTLTYTVIPYLLVILLAFGLTWAWFSDSAHGAAVIAAGLYFGSAAARHLIDLALWWRQLLRVKQTRVGGRMGWLRVKDDDAAERQADQEKQGMERTFRGFLVGTMLGWLLAAGLLAGLFLDGAWRHGWASGLPWARAVLIGASFGAAWFLWSRLFRTPNATEDGEPQGGPA